MTGDVPGQGGNFLEQLLGDLLQLMGSGGGGDRAELARTLAVSVATGGTAEANVDPVERIRFEELVRVAELHVAELTGLAPSGSGAPLAVEAVAPGAWAARTVTDWRFVLDVMAGSAPDESALRELLPEGEEAGGAAEIMARFMGTMGPMLAAMQLGSAIGHLARMTLGQYELPIPRASSGLLLVPANVTRFAEDWSLPTDDVRLWVSLREVTMHAVLGRPHVAERLRTLLQDVVRGMAGEALGMMQQLQSADLADPEALPRMLSDPDTMLGAAENPARRAASEQLMAVTAALLGYVEHVLDQTATRLLGGRGALAEAWRRRQVEREGAARTAEMLFGLDLGPAQVDIGVEFVRGVLERAGEDGLARLWRSAAMLPTPAEITAPGLWLERTSFEEPGAGS